MSCQCKECGQTLPVKSPEERIRLALEKLRELEPKMDDHTHKHWLLWKAIQILEGK